MQASRRRWVVATCALLAPFVSPAQDARPREASAVPELASPRELLREEFFALELSSPDTVTVAGYAAWRRRREDGGQVLELELAFPAEGTRVSHVERATHDQSRLVWREWRAGGGRTLHVQWPRGQAHIEVVEWGRADGLRTSWEATDGALMPLYLLELARHGDIERGAFTCVDPLSRSLERMQVSTAFSARASGTESFDVEHTVELIDHDGVTRGAYTFCGAELVGFRWARGDLHARRIPADEFVRALQAFERSAASRETTVTER